jgi:predicted MFS family arabinose efflux permease
LLAFMLAALVSNIGNWMQMFSEQWFTLLLAGPEAARWSGRLGFAAGLALFLFLPLGGAVADRLDRRQALRLSQFWLMLMAAAMGGLAWDGHLGLRGLLVFALLSGFGSALSMPLMHSLVGDLVAPSLLPAAMGVMVVQFNVSRVLGPSLAALLFPWAGAAGNFLLNALTFLPLIWVCGRLPRIAPQVAHTGEGSYPEAWAAFRGSRDLTRLLLLAAVSGFFAWTYFPLLPVYGARHLHLGERGVAALLSLFGLGAVVGGLWVARDREHADRRRRLFLAFAGFGLGLGLLGLFPRPGVAAPVFLALGLAQSTFVSLLAGLIQRQAPERLRGRMNGLYLLAIVGITPFGTLLAGEVAQRLGADGPLWVLGADGLILVGAAVLALQHHQADPR